MPSPSTRAQGVTVDRAVFVADEATCAEALYVGMTRGRHHNSALVVCNRLDDEHRAEPATVLDVLDAAMGRVSAEEAALDVLRRELAASESLATLAPRLANLDAWIARETPPDPAVELEHLVARRSYLDRTTRRGMLTRARRDDRRVLAALDARQSELEAAVVSRPPPPSTARAVEACRGRMRSSCDSAARGPADAGDEARHPTHRASPGGIQLHARTVKRTNTRSAAQTEPTIAGQ